MINNSEPNTINDIVGRIDCVFLAHDARTLTFGELPILVSEDDEGKDFDQFSVEEIMEVNKKTLWGLSSFYALDTVLDAINNKGFKYKLTKKQQKLLNDYYDRAKLLTKLSVTEIHEVVQMISKADYVHCAGYRRNQPEKDYADLQGLKMYGDEYLAILESITPDEFAGTIKGFEKDRLGIPLFEFNHDPKGYRLISGQTLNSNIWIYIKLILNYENVCNFAIISFHDKRQV